MTLAFLTGEQGYKTVRDYAAMLLAPPEDPMWLPWLPGQLSFEGCYLSLLGCMCDGWRRLVFPFDCLPWSLPPIAT